VPDKFLQLLNLSETDDHIKLGECAELTLTVMFSDIRSFTSLSEKLTLKEVFSFINSYTGRIGPIITKYNGFIDKYIGDSIMALFLSPDDAVQASIHMLNELDSYNKHRKASGYAPIAIGIGLNTGKVMMGTVGEVERIQTTVVGDAVNLAARIEHLTKVYRTPILITENVYKSLKDLSKYALKLIDKVNIIGKDEVVTVFEVLDSLPQELKNKKLQIKNIYEEACEFYAEKKYEEACNLFTKCVELCPEDVASNNYLKLCADILKT
jgi:class 3 adenylate cyclase